MTSISPRNNQIPAREFRLTLHIWGGTLGFPEPLEGGDESTIFAVAGWVVVAVETLGHRIVESHGHLALSAHGSTGWRASSTGQSGMPWVLGAS